MKAPKSRRARDGAGASIWILHDFVTRAVRRVAPSQVKRLNGGTEPKGHDVFELERARVTRVSVTGEYEGEPVSQMPNAGTLQYPEYGVIWTLADARAAAREGWGLRHFGSGLEIEVDDLAGILKSDDAALSHVEAGATIGFDLHCRALAIHRVFEAVERVRPREDSRTGRTPAR